MDLKQFERAAGISAGLAARWFPHINAAMAEFGITSPTDQSMFIAQVGHESAGFSRLIESLNYTPEALVATFGRVRITQYQADMLGRVPGRPANQEAIANLVYGGEWGKKNLGNYNAGDGWRYRGRGLIQITGLTNYRSCSAALGKDFLLVPDLLAQDEDAARSACWFYVSRGCLLYGNDLNKVTRIINGAANGLEDRRQRLAVARKALL
ncbi:glycoside hydrolase family 19 protein [Entomohabitans teleogrylli]|uniref:glycoside hydrolase family 19 protein n=1 Tax=Entomohabitans teleogrylli TaxID=1384589 RepID=UPI00073D25DA|nr:glycoside hydrolase family 19 protein [Entomohabitans teleogrylli]